MAVAGSNGAMSASAEPTLSALAPWLLEHVPGAGRPRRLVKFDAGQSNPTYRLETDVGVLVLRAKPPGPLLPSAHQVEREYRAMAALRRAGFPVPRVLALASDEDSPIGRAFYVMEHVAGRIFWDPALPELGPQERARVYDAMNTTLAALHRIDPAAVGLQDFGKPGNYFARQFSRWSRQYRAARLAPNADMDRLSSWLERHLPADDGQVALVHGDWRLDNMIFDTAASRVVAVLDWELATLGHPLADLAYQCMQWRLPHDAGMRGLGGLDRRALGLPTEGDYVARYLARRGLDAVADWPFYIAFSFFRLAAILEGVVRRAHDGNASNPETARRYARAIPILARMGVEAAAEMGG